MRFIRKNCFQRKSPYIFFKGPDGRDHGVVSPSINSTGDIYEWPDGFFDQAEKDLSQLIG